jgi:hypothetical protein
MPQFGAHCLETPSLCPVLMKRLVDLWLTAAAASAVIAAVVLCAQLP